METRRRLSLATFLAFLPVVPLSLRLAQLLVVEHRGLALRADDELDRMAVEAAPRAPILDRKGRVLAESLPSWACFLDKRMIKDPGKIAQELSGLLGVPAAEILSRYQTGRRFAWIKTDLDYDQATALKKARINGLGVVSRQTRFYPNGSLAENILGLVGSDGHGLSGIEYSENARLEAAPIEIQIIRDGAGHAIYEDTAQDSPEPKPLTLSIDRNIQFYASQILAEAAKKLSIKSGVIAVENPQTGAILAMADYPPTPLRNEAIQEMYEPGSVFKLVTAGAALNESVITPQETFFCENGAYQIAPGVVIHDVEPQGNLTIGGILRYSSNIGISKVVAKLGPNGFYSYVRAFGFTNKTGIDFPGETSGELRPLSQMTPVNLAAASYGYGVGVSPIQVLNAYSAVANGGVLMQPRVVEDGPPEEIRRVVSAKTDALLVKMFEGVVEQGTGVPAQIPGYLVAGKTGTARMIDPKTHQYSRTAYNASFVGFLPASRPRWTILILMGDPKGPRYYGDEAAAPYFGELARRLIALSGAAPDAPPDPPAPRTLQAKPPFGVRPRAALPAALRVSP
ncbi:MAG TPA: penicillin-binding protein 2 [Elusimicrobiota bacterium]|nr:penicillin-binding protein 2 [Elusimicrobiota bacterium]